MSAATKLLHELADHGVVLEAVGDVLRYQPVEAVSPAMLRRLKDHKGELLAALRSVATAPATPQPGRFHGWTFRPDCRGRMGLERPNLPEVNRWWTKSIFTDLPIPLSNPEVN